MSEQSMTRRSAVKLGGAALAAAGLPAGASAAKAPAGGTDYPEFRGKLVAFHIRAKRDHHLLSDPVFAVQGGRLFVTGTIPALGFWTDGLPAAFAWDLVEHYYVYESVEDYRSRCETYKKTKSAKAGAAATAN